MTYTTLQQAKELIKLGLSESTADMYYEQDTDSSVDSWKIGIGKPNQQQNPCWSAEVLLKTLPKTLYYDEDTPSNRFIVMNSTSNFEIFYEGKDPLAWEYLSNGTLIECLVDTIKWFYEMGIQNQLNLNL